MSNNRAFGFLFGNKQKNGEQEKKLETFSPEVNEDGALVVGSGGVYGTAVDIDGSVRNEADLISKYREAVQHPELDSAVSKIVNEAIVQDEDDKVVTIVLDQLKYSESVKKLITEEFNRVLDLLDFGLHPYNVFHNWYVDGRLYYHVVVDKNDPGAGIQEMRYIDPRNIRKVKETQTKLGDNGVAMTMTMNEYYLYSPNGFGTGAQAGALQGPSNITANKVKIAKDSIVYVTSGLTNPEGNMILSYMHKALKLLSQLRSLEDSMVIYRISRAPERRIFYIDVSGLTKSKAEQYLRDTMNRFKNKVVYDSKTGQIRDDRKFMTMLEDFWLPRRDGGKGTEITTLPGGQNLGQIDDIVYFQKNLYKALNVPVQRLEPDTSFSLGRGSEITREEIDFSKFITRIRGQFAQLFTKTLGTQLILKNIITPEEWEAVKNRIRYDFNKDNFYEELKETEILRERITTLQQMDDFAGKYYSHIWIRKNVLRQSDELIAEMDKQMEEEREDPRYQAVEDGAMGTNPPGMFGGGSSDDGQPAQREPTGDRDQDEPEE